MIEALAVGRMLCVNGVGMEQGSKVRPKPRSQKQFLPPLQDASRGAQELRVGGVQHLVQLSQ